jgi:hypothetical protein
MDTWTRVSVHLAFYFNLELVRKVPDLQDTDEYIYEKMNI